MNCDSIAFCYRHLEHLVFGHALEQRRQEYLAEAASAKNVLILGDGDGRFTAKLARLNAAALIDSVDVSVRMLHLAKQRIDEHERNTTRLRFLQADARTIDLPPGKYDLIVSHFFLDCFTPHDLPILVERLSRCACSPSQWLISEFRVPDRGLPRLAGALLIKAMYLFFRAFTGLKANRLPDYAAALTRYGFRRARHKFTWGGLLVSELWEKQ